MVNAFLVGVNFWVSPGRWWVQWVMFGWGIGVASHAFSVFAYRGFFGAQWEERKVRELMEQRRGR
jgi:hypothetical protein